MSTAIQPELTPTQAHAQKVIKRLLAKGPMSARVFTTMLEAEGVSAWSRQIATQALGVKAVKAGVGWVYKYVDSDDEAPRLGRGWECPTCGGYGWVHGKPQHRNPRGIEREQAIEKDRAYRRQRGGTR